MSEALDGLEVFEDSVPEAKAAADELRRLDSYVRWRGVAEELPTVAGVYLCIYVEACGCCQGSGLVEFDGHGFHASVTHWVYPLPFPLQ